MYKAIVTKLKNVRPHSNADKVQLATCHGNQVVIGLDSQEDHFGVYFPSDGVLSHEFCHANNLYRHPDLNKDKSAKPGMFDENRRVRAQKFRGEVSDGFWVPLHYFAFIKVTGLDNEGFEFDEWCGVPVCSKYVNQATLKIARENQGKKTKNAKTSIMFKEHFETAHFGRSLHEFDKGQYLILTEKVHGTSARIGYVLVDRKFGIKEKIAKWFGAKIQEKEWLYMNGTRRTVLEEKENDIQYHDPTIRDKAFKLFKGNLRKGETVFLEIVGYESTGAAIMPAVDTTKMNDKEFTKRYGKLMPYSYGCQPKECEIYVYRITTTNEDGHSIDYCWDDVVRRCKEIGVKHVPHLLTTTFNEIELDYKNKRGLPADAELDPRNLKTFFTDLVESSGSGHSSLDPNHIKEGVCVRIEGGLSNKTFKFKSFEFKVLEGIVKDSGVVDAEEAEG